VRSQVRDALVALPADLREEIETPGCPWEDTPPPLTLMPPCAPTPAVGDPVVVDGEHARVLKTSRKRPHELKVRFKGSRRKAWLLDSELDLPAYARLDAESVRARTVSEADADSLRTADVLRALGVAWVPARLAAVVCAPPPPPPREGAAYARAHAAAVGGASESSSSSSDDGSSDSSAEVAAVDGADPEPATMAARSTLVVQADTSSASSDESGDSDDETPAAAAPAPARATAARAPPSSDSSSSTSSGSTSASEAEGEDAVAGAAIGAAVSPPSAPSSSSSSDSTTDDDADDDAASEPAAREAGETTATGTAGVVPAAASGDGGSLRSLFMQPEAFSLGTSLFGGATLADVADAAAAAQPRPRPDGAGAGAAAQPAPPVRPAPEQTLRPVLFARTQPEAELTAAWQSLREAGFKDFKSKTKVDKRNALKRNRAAAARGVRDARKQRVKS
jgi:hypothetical protein